MNLGDLLDDGFTLTLPSGAPGPENIPITAITADSREVTRGAIFAALEGTWSDGLTYLPQALEKGAGAVLLRSGRGLPGAVPVPVIYAKDPRKALSRLAARIHPGQPDMIAAVTGTNGKTSVAGFLRQIWAGLGHRAASMGTLGIVSPDETLPLAHTTPDPVKLHSQLHHLKQQAVSHLVLEASSHGLAQARLDQVHLKAAGFTNLTRDHLDYHGTMEAYRDAKLGLFTRVLPMDGTAVVNLAGAGGPLFTEAARAAGRRVLTVGTPGAILSLEHCAPVASGMGVRLAMAGQVLDLIMPLYGRFQAENALVALGLACATGNEFMDAARMLAHLQGAPGRLERIGASGRGAPVFVDYAHTPDALETVLRALKPHVTGRLHVVFGCGGDRDAGKRPQMGAVAARIADIVTVTDDNPRGEDPAEIRRAIMRTCPGALEIGDRAQAIAQAVHGLEAGDVLIVAGKGHETGQIVGETVLPFSDGDVLRSLLPSSGQASPDLPSMGSAPGRAHV